MKTVTGPLREEFEQNGFAILRGVFDPDEISVARSQLTKIFKSTDNKNWWSDSINLANCLDLYPELVWLSLNRKVIEGVRTALGNENIVFVNVFGVQKNMLSDWHRDDGTGAKSPDDGYFGKTDLLCEDLKCVRVAIYLQDHNESSPGLYVKPGSHLQRKGVLSAAECLNLQAGDVIIFDVRLVHSGTFQNKWFDRLLKATAGKSRVCIRVLTELSRKLMLKFRPPKFSVFLVYGAENKFSTTYGINMMKNQQSISGGNPKLPDDIAQKFKSLDVSVLDKF